MAIDQAFALAAPRLPRPATPLGRFAAMMHRCRRKASRPSQSQRIPPAQPSTSMEAGNDTVLLAAGMLAAGVALWLMRNVLRILYVAALIALALWLSGLVG